MKERTGKIKKRLPAEALLTKKRVRKLRLIVVFFLLAISLLMSQIFRIKADYGDEYDRKAIIQQVTKNGVDNTISPNRGAILDRDKSIQALAVSTTVYNVIFDVKVMLEEKQLLSEEKRELVQQDTIEKVSRILEIPVETLESYIAENPNSNYVKIAKKISGRTKELLEAENPKHIWFEADTQRNYPSGDLAASLIGFTRGDNSNWGLEAMYNDQLTGISGRLVRLYDTDNNASTEQIDPIQGNTLITTIDLVIQQEAEKLVAKYGEITKAENACLLVMNPNTGEVLAMAEYPTFDLNDPFDVEKINAEEARAAIEAAPEEDKLTEYYKVWRNFAVSDTFEPGSIYKPLVIAAALEEGIVSGNDTFYCSGKKYIAGRSEPVPCWHVGHGHLNYKEILSNSCNVGAMEIIERLGREKYYQYQTDYGIGVSTGTGIDVIGEPNTEYVVHGLAALNPTELAVSGMGQGFNTTALQMITAFSATINGGNLMKPYLVSQIIDENDKIVEEHGPVIQRKVLSKETSDLMKAAMVGTLETGGTGAKAAIPGYKIGGKTGTAQQGIKIGDGSEELALDLITYFPADNPKYVVLAAMTNPANYVEGDSQTMPMVKELMLSIIQQKKIPADIDGSETYETQDNTVIIDDYIGKSTAEVTNNLNYLGFTYDISGNGSLVKSQFPAGGAKVTKGSKIYLTVEAGEEGENLVLIPNVIGMTKEQAIETISSANLVPISANNAKQKVANGEISEEQGAVAGEVAVVETVISQLPKYEIKVQPKTEILIYFDVQE